MISTPIRRHDLVGNGTAGPFTYQFLIRAASDLLVYVDGNLKTLTTHYTVTGVGVETGGTVTFTTGNEPAVNAHVQIVGSEPYTQTADFQTAATLPAAALEEVLDKQTRLLTQLNERANRTPVMALPDHYNKSAIGLSAPVAGQFLRWDSLAQNLEPAVPTTTPIGLPVGGNYDHLTVNGSGTVAWAQQIYNFSANYLNVSKYASFAAAITAIGATPTRLLVSTSQAITGNVSVPKNVIVELVGQGAFVVSNGVTLTFATPWQILAPRRTQIFSGSGTWTIAFTDPGLVLPAWWGFDPASTAANNKTALQAAITSAPNESEVYMDGGTYLLSGGVTITNKVGLNIHGKATLQLSGAASGSYIFEKVGTITRLRIAEFTMLGDNNAAYGQTAIGCASGQTISDSIFELLTISNINVGISCNADLSGSYTKSTIRFNRISNIIGTSTGQGYGIHLANATDCDVFMNSIDTASRHAIYQAKGGQGVRILSNVVRNHRNGVATGNYLCAYVISRSNRVTFADNHNIDGYDGGLELSYVTADALNNDGVIVANNHFINRKNVIADVVVGEQAVPGSYRTRQVTITGNQFYNDYTNTGSGNADIYLLNGQYLHITGNVHRCINVNGNRPFINAGHNSYVTLAADLHETTIKDNMFIAEGPGLTLTVGVNFCSDVSTLAGSIHWVGPNRGVNIATQVGFDATQTNPNIVKIGLSGGRVGVYTAADTTPSVYGVTQMDLTNGGATSITDFDDGENGQEVTLWFNDGNTTLVNGANLLLNGASNKTGTANDVLRIVRRNNKWYQAGTLQAN